MDSAHESQSRHRETRVGRNLQLARGSSVKGARASVAHVPIGKPPVRSRGGCNVAQVSLPVETREFDSRPTLDPICIVEPEVFAPLLIFAREL